MAKTSIKPRGFMMPLPAVLLSCQRSGQKPNIITLSWCGVVCSEPPMIGVGIMTSRFSYDIIKDAGEFVINIPTEDQVRHTDFCGHVSGRDEDKFEKCGFTPKKGSEVSAPIIKECPVNIECRTVQSILLGSHELFIGEIVAIHAEEGCIDEKGYVDIEKVKPFVYVPMAKKYVGGIDKILGLGGFSIEKD